MTTKQNVIKQLNILFELDKGFTEKIVDTRYSVNQAYQNSEEFVCMDDGVNQSAGLIGVLNGLLDQDEHRIAASYNDITHELIGFILVKK